MNCDRLVLLREGRVIAVVDTPLAPIKSAESPRSKRPSLLSSVSVEVNSMRMFAVARRIILQIGKDPRTVVLLVRLVFALLLLKINPSISGVSMPRVGLVDVPELWLERFTVEMDIAEYYTEQEAREAR